MDANNHSIQFFFWLGMLAACFKLNSGADVVRVVTLLNGPGLTLAHSKMAPASSSPTSQTLYWDSESTGRKGKTDELLITSRGAQGREFKPHSLRSFSGHFSFDRDNVCSLYMCLFYT